MTAKKQGQAGQFQGDEERVQELLTRRQALAEALHSFTDRRRAEEEFAPIFTADEGTQMLLIKQLVRERDMDSADLLLAMHELAPGKAIRKEARRALIQLAGAKIYPSWTPEPEEPAVGVLGVENPPRFWQGRVSAIRESGEVQLILCWEQGIEYGDGRILSFLLDFWQDGVKDFFTEVGSRHHIQHHIDEIQARTRQVAEGYTIEDTREGVGTGFVDCTLAEGRRLLNEALSINRWRKTEPHKDFRQYLSLVQRLVLHATDVGEDRGLTFIAPDLEPDMLAANFTGAWSMGDYGLCYDLLTRTNPLAEGHDRDEWIELRRKWADEAHPSRFEIYFFHEREPKPQSTLWLPSSVLSRKDNEQKEVEMAWSLELTPTQLSGTLPEMPLGTAVYKETRRHWFSTVFTAARADGEWRIAAMKDEGLAAQGLPTEELRKRIKEHDDVLQGIMREHQPTDEEAQQYVDEIIRRNWQILALDDALLAKNPQDKTIYEDAYGRAMALRAVERAVVYAEAMVTRFPNDLDHLTAVQRLGALQIAVSERFADLRVKDQAEHFERLGEATLRSVLHESDPMGYMLLAEFLISRGKYDEAEVELLKARELAQETDVKAQVDFDLANMELGRERFAQAQRYLEQVAELQPNHPALWATLGFVHRNQENYPEAEVFYRRALEEDPSDVRVYSELGAVYISQNEYIKARDVLAQGIRAQPQSAHLRALMASLYLRQNDHRRAKEYLEEAERINPDLEIVQAVRELVKTK